MPESPLQLDLEAVAAIRDPEVWLEDTLLWLLEAGDPLHAQAVLSILQDIRNDRDDLVAQIVTDALQAEADALSQQVVSGG